MAMIFYNLRLTTIIVVRAKLFRDFVTDPAVAEITIKTQTTLKYFESIRNCSILVSYLKECKVFASKLVGSFSVALLLSPP